MIPTGDVLPNEQLERGSHGPGVAQLQHFLIRAGLMDPSAIRWREGLYGPRTTEAIAAFQETNRIEGEHGVFDAAVRAALLEGWPRADMPPAPEPTPSPEASQVPDIASAPTAPEVSDPAVGQEQAKWQKQLEDLADMGFVEIDRNVALLERFKGAVPFVVSELLG